MTKHIVYHIPVCPFSQRLEILLALRGLQDVVEFRVVDITKPRDPELLRKTRGTTALPVLETSEGKIIKESLVILRFLDEVLEGPRLRRSDPGEHAVESMLIAKEGPFTMAGYIYVMNQDIEKKEALNDTLLSHYRGLNDFLVDVPYTMSGNKEFEERKRNFYMDGRITGNYISSTDPEAMPNIKIYDNLGDVTLHMTFLLNNGTVQITNRFMVRRKKRSIFFSFFSNNFLKKPPLAYQISWSNEYLTARISVT